MSTVETLTTTVLDPHECAIEPLDERGSAVRFDTQCVVIPDHVYRSPRLPRVVTKSYALPLWRRRSSSAGPSNTRSPPDHHPSPSPEENQSHLVLRLPLPTLSLKSPPSVRPPDLPPLPPCLVHRPQRSASGSFSSPTQTRHARNPRKASLSPTRADIITVPLRPCCAACQPVTEAALINGDAWQEHFSRAASRRRSMSADSGPRTITVAGSAASASYGTLGVSINVDEVDKRRRSSDTGPCATRGEMAPWSDDAKAREERKVSLTVRRSGPTNSVSAGDAHVPPSPSPTHMTPATPRIPEEEDDEDDSELFPLPSPKRTPGSSPAPSPAGSLSSLMVAHGSQNCSTCSGDSPNPLHANKRRDLLAPPSCPSTSSLSLPRQCDSTTNLSEDSHRAPPSPNVLSTLPSLSSRHRSRSPSPLCTFDQPGPIDALSLATRDRPLDASPEAVPAPVPIALPSHPSQSPSLISLHSPLSARLPWRSKRSVSADSGFMARSPPPPSSFSPSTSPPSSFSLSGAKKTFGMTNPRHVIADVLRGVGAVTSGGIGPGI